MRIFARVSSKVLLDRLAVAAPQFSVAGSPVAHGQDLLRFETARTGPLRQVYNASSSNSRTSLSGAA